MATYRNSDEALMERVRRYIKGLGYYAKPPGGIPASDLAGWVLPSAVTDKAVGELGYTKNEGTVTGAKVNNVMIEDEDGVIDIGTVVTDVSGKADIASPTFTGVPKAPTPSVGTNNTQIATTAFVTTAVADAIAGVTGIEYTIVASLPATGEAGVIYLIANSGSGQNIYDEYIWVNNAFEKIGTTEIDLTNYATKSEVDDIVAEGTSQKAQSIPFGGVDGTSTATAFTATVEGITALEDGVCCYLKNTVVTSAAATSNPKCWTLNINNLGAKPVYVTTAAATYSTTQFAKNYKYLFTYDSSLNSGNGGWYIGQLFNTNTTYSDMTQAEIDAGTGTTGRKITPKMLRDNFYTEGEVDGLLDDKQDVIDDLATIRSGAALGATALQSYTETDPTVPAWAKAAQKPSYSYSEITNTPTLATVATSGSYTDLDDKPTIPTVPTNVSAFTNDAGYITGYTETDPTVPAWAKASSKPSYTAAEVGALPDTTAIPTESTVSGWGFTKNAGTITGITMNGASKGTSGVVDLGTVITSHQDVSGKENTSNKVTSLSSSSTDTQYPSAKCVYDLVGDIETLLAAI